VGNSNDNLCNGTFGAPGVTFEDNVDSGCGTLQYITTGGSFAAGALNFNIYAASPLNPFVYLGTTYSSAQFSSWQSATGQDANSSYQSSAGLSASGFPQAGSPAIRRWRKPLFCVQWPGEPRPGRAVLGPEWGRAAKQRRVGCGRVSVPGELDSRSWPLRGGIGFRKFFHPVISINSRRAARRPPSPQDPGLER
jgi:hypothetical protein